MLSRLVLNLLFTNTRVYYIREQLHHRLNLGWLYIRRVKLHHRFNWGRLKSRCAITFIQYTKILHSQFNDVSVIICA